ncbi:MAG: transposase [Candidatus Poribacteria bacterium]|nr:transposase [Candidatus Poribacteria bacterium]
MVLEVPQGIELFYLPPYTPELQPAERLWSLLREVVENKFLQLSALEEVLVERCRWFSKNREKVQAHVGFE